MKAQLHELKLVYPPVSNQEAEWFRGLEDEDLREQFRRSNLYMIGCRAEARFEEPQIDREARTLSATYAAPGIGSSHFSIDLQTLEQRTKPAGIFDIEIGAKMIRAWSLDENDEPDEVLDWFTTEKILYDKWRGHPDVRGLDDYRNFTRYELLYVGISQENDSFTRLVERAHEKRVRILSNESPRAPGARVTDELVLFFFRVEPIRFHVLENPHDPAELEEMLSPTFDKARIVSDAEKAFTSVLQAKYNTIRYAKYPQGPDGLYAQGLSRYAYVLGADITFTTESATIRGSHNAYEKGPAAADMILVDGDAVTLVHR